MNSQAVVGTSDTSSPTLPGHNSLAKPSRFRPLIKASIAVGVVAAVGFGWYAWSPGGEDSAGEQAAGDIIIHTIESADFEAFVTEYGDLESASNVEVRCEVRSPSGGGTTILKIVEEGTIVEAGEELIQFDDASLKINLTQQEILVATDSAGVIDAQSEHDKAVQALKEYESGTFPVEQATLEGELLQAESDLKAGEDALVHTQRMYTKGFVTRIQLEAGEKSVAMAKKQTEVAEIKLRVLRDFTFEKMVNQFKADIEKQKANLTAAKHTQRLSQQRLKELEQQIANCRVVAPSAGQVVYANDYDRSNNVVIEEGAQIREGQVVIRLPDPTQMQVDTRINDSKIKFLKTGNPVEIILDADPDLPVRGQLAKVEPFPFPRRWHGAPIEYGATVAILDPPPGVRPGQRAKVKIYVERREDVLQAPIQSIVMRNEKHYCLAKSDDGAWSATEIQVGSNNDRFVVVEGGLTAGDQVALNPELLWDNVVDDDLKDAAEPEEESQDVARLGP